MGKKNIIPGFRTNILWKKVLAVFGYIFLLFIFIVILTTSSGYGNHTDANIEKVCNIIITFIIIGIPFLIITNFMGIRDKLPLFKKHKMGFTILGSFVTYIVIAIGCSVTGIVAAELYSEQYYADVREASELREKEEKAAAEKRAKEEARKKAKEEARKKAEEEAQKKAAAEKKAKEEAQKKAEEEARKKAEEEAQKKVAAEKKAKEEAQKKALMEKKAKEEAEMKAKAEKEKRAREEAEKKIKAEKRAEKKAATSAYCSLEYQEYYLKKCGIMMIFSKERERTTKYLNEFDEKKAVNVEYEDGTLFKTPYYKQTRYISEFVYYGGLSENKPQGLGIIKRKIDLSIIENGIGDIKKKDKDKGYALVTVYAGYFREGRPDGYGLQFATPLDEDYDILKYDLQKFYKNVNDDVQQSITASLNPLIYEGEFHKGKYNGMGATYIYDDLVIDRILMGISENSAEGEMTKNITVYQGEYLKGEQNGKFRIYSEGYLSYEGDVKNGNMTGKGVIYYNKSNQIQYKGELIMGVPNGKGTRYNKDGTVEYSGEWSGGDYAG